ncbi:hypothetical protein BDV96DRAFT_185788 [Lophiotrema nucula]|uniref:BZIP transcription factor n=1 Tax=Lophiotrema nucula TaxID=690887 RepID=A0A6A5YZP5_9PLEO|nr:hypothetical protein BDV96DRAFT_185788 [Lophiotrema nucula]
MAGEASSSNGDAGSNDTPDSSQPAPKRRRTGGAGGGTSSRGVANLTPEQLARKRANDREAQRAIRERTKNHIDRLNERIRDLESQQPYNDLQVVLREKLAVENELIDVRKRLESVVAIIQPILRTSGGLNELAAAAERSPLPVLPPRDPTSHPPDPRTFHTGVSSFQDAVSPHNGIHSPAGTEPGRQWIYPGDAPTSHLRRYSGDSPHQFEHPPPRAPQIQGPDTPFDERMGVDFLLENRQRPVDPNLPNHTPAPANLGPGHHAPVMAPYLTMPRNIPATCPLDVIMLDFLADRLARANEGVPVKTLVGPMYPNFTALVYPERNVDAHPLSRLFTDILRTFPDVKALPEQVAIVFIMFLIMRWQIEPTQENYDRLPDWVTPRASQLFISHPCWMDHLPWPRLRDKIITTQPFTPFETFFIPFTTTISLNWPYESRDCLLPASKVKNNTLSTTSSIAASSPYSTAVHAGSPPAPPTPLASAASPGGTTTAPLPKEDDQWLINPAFESHLRDVRNWSLGPSFRSTFPSFADVIRIKEGGR